MEQDLSLLIGLLVALVVFISVTLLAIKLIRSKTRTASIYNMASIGNKTRTASIYNMASIGNKTRTASIYNMASIGNSPEPLVPTTWLE